VLQLLLLQRRLQVLRQLRQLQVLRHLRRQQSLQMREQQGFARQGHDLMRLLYLYPPFDNRRLFFCLALHNRRV